MADKSRKTAFFIALRYLFSKKEHNAINVISGISMLGIMVSTAALVVVLSVFNGLASVIGGWFNAFHADFEISLNEGKSFKVSDFPLNKISELPEVSDVFEVVCDLALMSYDDKQELVHLKGVPQKYLKTNNLDKMVFDGTPDFFKAGSESAVIGTGVAGKLQINLLSYEQLKLYYPKRTKKHFANAAESFYTKYMIPAGVIATNTNYDDDYVFCSIDFVRALMDFDGEATSVEVKLKKNADSKACRKQLEKILGDKYSIKDLYEQEASLYKTMKSEKLMVYVILAFILVLAAFNIIGAVGMLMIEKESDMAVLFGMGASKSLIAKIFVYEGMLVSALGGFVGVILGTLISLLQQIFHIVKIGGAGGSYIIPYYPVQIHISDLAIVFATILIISLITSLIPALQLRKYNIGRI